MRIPLRIPTVLIILMALSFPVLASDQCQADSLPRLGEIRADRVLVKLAPEAANQAESLPERGLPRGVSSLDDFLARHGIREGHRLVRTHGVPIGDPELFRRIGLDRWYVLLLPDPGRDRIGGLLRELRREPSVERAEAVTVEQMPLGIPNDPSFDLQWHHHNTGQTGGTADADIDSPEGWDLGTGNPTGVIAFLDSGVDHDHEDLVGAITAGYDFVYDDDDPEDDYGHGTNTAGLAAARANNGIGVAGVCWGCQVMPLKIYDASSPSDLERWIDAIRWGADRGADVIGSMGGMSALPYQQALLDGAAYAMGRGTLLVCVNGNMYTQQAMAFPTIPGVMAVGATDANDARVLSWGDHLALSAPGWDTYTTALNDSYGTLSGTCPAVALVSGLAGLLRAQDESLHIHEIRHLLELGADDQVGIPEEDTPGWDQYMGWGRINVHGSLSRIDGPWVALDRPHYMCAGQATIALKDKTAGGSAEVTLTVGLGKDTETVTVLPLTENGYYEGSIPISWTGRDGPAVAQDGKLDVEHGDTITATAGGNSASAFVECVKDVCHLPLEAPVVAGDCDADGAADPGEWWSIGLVLHSSHTEPLPGPEVVLESADPYVEILNDTFSQDLLFSYSTFYTPVAYPDYTFGGGPAVIRTRAGTPVNHVLTLNVASIHGAGWENDPDDCAARFGEPTIAIRANRDLGPVQNRWDFDDGTAQGYTSDVAHGTGDLSECETTTFWRDDWESNPVSDRSHSGDYAMRLGNGNGYWSRVDAGLITPPFDVPAEGGAIAFHSWTDSIPYRWGLKWLAREGFTIEAKTTVDPVWSYLPEGTYGHRQQATSCGSTSTVPFGWMEPARLFAGDGDGTDVEGDRFDRQHQVNLEAFAGSTVQARFRFGSMADYYVVEEPGEGVWIDTVTVHPWVADSWPGEAPANLQGSEANCPASYDLIWDPVEGAGAYNVYRSELSCADAGASLDAYGQSPTAEFSDTGVVEGVGYYYAVEALEAGLGCPSERACIPGGCEGVEYGSIAGTALLEGESDHSGIAISTLPASSTAVTGTDGSYVLSSVPVGTYSVLATKDGWTEGRVDGVDVAAGQTTTGIDFLLDPVGGNLPPVAEDQSVDTFMNQAVTITLEASDPDEDPLTYFCVDLPANGMLSGCEDGDPYVTYTPDFKFTGIDTFTFKANDGALDSNLATVTVNVTKRGPGGG